METLIAVVLESMQSERNANEMKFKTMPSETTHCKTMQIKAKQSNTKQFLIWGFGPRNHEGEAWGTRLEAPRIPRGTLARCTWHNSPIVFFGIK